MEEVLNQGKGTPVPPMPPKQPPASQPGQQQEKQSEKQPSPRVLDARKFRERLAALQADGTSSPEARDRHVRDLMLEMLLALIERT